MLCDASTQTDGIIMVLDSITTTVLDSIKHEETTIHRSRKVKRKTLDLNIDNSIQFNADKLVKYYQSSSGQHYIIMPKCKTLDIIHTTFNTHLIKHHYKNNFMTLTKKCYFNKIYSGVYVGNNESFILRYFSDLTRLKDYEINPKIWEAIINHENFTN
jgi:hypothetical protein